MSRSPIPLAHLALVRRTDGAGGGTPGAAGPRAADTATLYREHAATVGRWAARLGGPGADLEDIVHEVFVIAHRKRAQFRHEAEVTTWLYRITASVVGRRRRKERLRRWLFRPDRDEAAAAARRVRAPSADQAAALEQREEIGLVYRVLDRLPGEDRALLILFEIEDLSGEQIASLLGMKLPTVWVKLHRARKRFLAALQREERRAGRGMPATAGERR
jgi:RNA polymerase sigma-70 factor (ECF subfamily)